MSTSISPPPPRPSSTPTPQPPRQEPDSPWRAEGLPPAPDGAPRRNRPHWRRVLPVALLAYALVFLAFSWQDRADRPQTVAYTEFNAQVDARNVQEVFARGLTIQGVLKAPAPLPGAEQGTTYTRFVTERPVFVEDDLFSRLASGGATVRATPVVQERGFLANLLLSFGPILLLVALYVWLFRRQQGALGGLGGLGGGPRKPVEPESVRVSFDDVAGIEEVENEIAEVVDFLRSPEKYRRLGARVPKGVLLAGPPGTGKTLLARATAGEAGVPFFSASASEFIEMIVGVGARRVRELFAEARKVAPAIIFIDEIDTIGRARGGPSSVGGHDEREQTLNQILTEMDGFSGSEGVVVLAATNRPDVLDPALLRPGRFDRTIMVSPPDVRGRAEILRVHTRDVPLAPDVDLDAVARSTPGSTGADLANLVNEAALLAARRGLDRVGRREFADALERIQLGAARAVVIPPEERERTAYHEAGHALLGMLEPGADPVRKISIIPRGRALGVTLSTPEADRYAYSADYLRGRIRGALGGMAAEDVVYGVVTTGAENDLETLTRIARSMVGRWGMSERIGPLSVLPPEGEPYAQVAPATLEAVDTEARRIVEECYDAARDVLRSHRTNLDALARALLERETLDEAEAYAAAGIPRRRPVPAEPVKAGVAAAAR